MAVTKLSAIMGVSVIKVKIAMSIAKALMKQHLEPDLYADVYLAKKTYHIERVRGSAFIRHRYKRLRKIAMTRKAQDKIVATWNKSITLSTNGSYALEVVVWDKDVLQDDHVGSAHITLDGRLQNQGKICIRGMGQLNMICFSVS